MCDVIPGVTNQIRAALGTVNRPFAIPGDDGQQIEITLLTGDCDAASPGFVNIGGGTREDDYFTTILFEPPGGGAPNAVVLTTNASKVACEAAVAAATPLLSGGAGTCRVVSGGTKELSIPDDATIGFRFPDTDADLAPNGDDHTFTGPVAIAVTLTTDALPFDLATTRCADRAGLVACVDELYAKDGSCAEGAAHLHPIFPHFTALPPANDYQALCTTPGSECTGLASELRFAVDAAGNALIPIEWRGVLLRPDGIPVPRLVNGSTDFPAFLGQGSAVQVPGRSFLASYSPEGHRLPPLFEPVSDPGSPAALALLGSVDAPVGVIRVARRAADLTGPSPVYHQCSGGANDGRPCVLTEECPGGACGQATCHLDQVDTTNACTNDTDCGSGEECGPALFDFGDRLDGGVGPVLVSSVDYTTSATSPVPIEGLSTSENLIVSVELESIGASTSGGPAPQDLNGDGDTTDNVVVVRDRTSGQIQEIGTGGAVGRAATRIIEPPFSSSAAALEDDVVAFLETEPRQFGLDSNGDGDVFDSILRVFVRNPGCTQGQPCAADELLSGSDLAVDAAPLVNDHSVVVSGGLVFFRSAEASSAPTVEVSQGIQGAAPRTSADGRHALGTVFGTVDRDTDADGIFDEPGATATLVGDHQAISGTGRFIVIRSAMNLQVLDRDVDEDGILDENGQTSTSILPFANTVFSSISDDGRHVAFDQHSNLPNVDRSVFVHDRDADGNGIFDEPGMGATLTVLLSEAMGGGAAEGFSAFPTISADGSAVVFKSDATTLVANDTNDLDDVFVYDRDTDGNDVFDEPGGVALERVTIGSDGSQQNLDLGLLGSSVQLSLSADGRYVSFISAGSNLVAGDTNGEMDFFVRDRKLGLTRRVSLDADGLQIAEPLTIGGGLAPDGRYASFDTNEGGGWRIWRADLLTGHTEELTTSTEALGPVPSNGGRHIAYLASNGGALVSTIGIDTAHLASDLSGNSLLDDTVLRVLDTQPESVTTVCPANAVVVAGTRAAFQRPESSGVATGCPNGPGPDPADLNNDGDVEDDVVHLYTHPGSVQNLATEATVIDLSTDYLAALVPTGVPGETAVQVADLALPPALAPIGAKADALQLVGSTLAFTTRETSSDLNGDADMDDRVLFLYDASTQTTTPVGQAAEEFVLGESLLAFRTSEAAQGGLDLNGDGDALDSVLQVYDLVSGQLFSSGQAAIPCRLEACDPTVPYRVSGDVVTFLTLEADQGGQDLDDSGSTNDVVIQTFNVRAAAEAAAPLQGAASGRLAASSSFGPSGACETLASTSAGVCTSTAEACASDIDCAGGTCFVPPGGCVEDLAVACDPEPLFASCGPGEFCVPVLGNPGVGSCHANQGPCGSDSDCTPPAVCLESDQDALRLFGPLADQGDGTQVFLSRGLQPSRTGAACTQDADCAGGEVCNEAGACQLQRGDLVIVAAADGDGDGVADLYDNCPFRPNTDQMDDDGDGVGTLCDLTPVPEPGQILQLAAGLAMLCELARRRRIGVTRSPG